MKDHVAVSFENGVVKVVHGSFSRGNFTIQETHLFDEEGFDSYLKSTRNNQFIVVNDFPNPSQALVYLPPAEERYLAALAEAEVRKRFPELGDFTFFFTVLKESQKEGKRLKETFIYAVSASEVHAIMDRFAMFGKTVKAVYPNVLTLVSLMGVSGAEPEESALGVIDLGSSKTMFIAANGRVCFVRVAQSDGRGLNALDVENINMTLAYARQSLRLSPGRVLVFDVRDVVSRAEGAPVVPMGPVVYPSNILADDELIARFVAPISALYGAEGMEAGNLLPRGYRTVAVERRFLRYAAAVLLVLSVATLPHVAGKAREMADLSRGIQELRREISGKEDISAGYRKASADLNRYMPVVTFMNQVNSTPDVARFLSSLSSLPARRVRILSVGIRVEKEGLVAKVDGRIAADTFTDLDSHYQAFLARARMIPGAEVATQKLELKNQSFTVDVQWKG